MSNTKKWIWESEQYPEFPHNKDKLLDKIGKIEHLKGQIDGILSFVSEEELDAIEIVNITEEIMGTSAIEGEYLRRESVRDSVAKKINHTYHSSENHATRHTDALAELMLDCLKNSELITQERLHGWHNALFSNSEYGDSTKKINIASFRDYDDMKVIENRFSRGGAIVKYIAPPCSMIENDINSLLKYCNHSNENPYIKSAIVHLWFVSIHPYDDGNGRISRALLDYVLAHDTTQQYKAYSISSAILTNRTGYYEMLDETTNLFKNRHYDFTTWIAWHMDTLIKALQKSLQDVKFIVKKTKFWDRHRDKKLNDRQVKVIEKMINDLSQELPSILTTKQYKEITQTLQLTASRDIKNLLDQGVVQKVEGKGGRSVSYTLLFDDVDM
jgi:Fic family protein